MAFEVWGTFAVADHLLPRAFVADVLLYDRLLIPFPATEVEQVRWRQNKWNPDRLEQVLEILERNSPSSILRVPWTEKREAKLHREWTRRIEVDLAQLRGDERVRQARLYNASRRAILEDVEVSRAQHKNKNTRYLAGTHGVYGEVVPAFDSFAAFRRELMFQQRISAADVKTDRVWRLAGVFGFELFVPEDTKRTDLELLSEAALLANSDDIREKRVKFHELRRDYLASGFASNDALNDLKERLKAYREATARTTQRKRLLNGFTLVGVGASLAGDLQSSQALTVAGGFFQLGQFALQGLIPQRPIKDEQKPVAMFHDARRRFGWHQDE